MAVHLVEPWGTDPFVFHISETKGQLAANVKCEGGSQHSVEEIAVFPHETTLNLYRAVMNLAIQLLQMQSMTSLHSLGKKRALKKMIKETANYSKISTIEGLGDQGNIEKLLYEKFNMQDEEPESSAQLIKNLLKKHNKPGKHGRFQDEDLIMVSSEGELDDDVF